MSKLCAYCFIAEYIKIFTFKTNIFQRFKRKSLWFAFVLTSFMRSLDILLARTQALLTVFLRTIKIISRPCNVLLIWVLTLTLRWYFISRLNFKFNMTGSTKIPLCPRCVAVGACSLHLPSRVDQRVLDSRCVMYIGLKS